MSKILIVEDEESIAELEKDYLELSGFQVETEKQGDTGLKRALEEDFDLVILDLMLPGVDGFEICKKVRETKNIPILMVSAKKDDIDKIRGLGMGADDYMTKPFSPKELMARIKAILKRNNKTDDNIFEYKTLKVDKIGHSVFINDKEVLLTPKEYNLLTYFIDNKNVALSREQLLSKVWGYDFFGDDRTIDTHIKMLRNNLGEYRDLIKTVRAVGYKFEIKD